MGNEIEKLLEQMPKVTKVEIYSHLPVDIGLWAAQAQREADARWIVEQGLVRLPSEEERQQWLNQWEGYLDKYLVEEYDRWLQERG